MILRYATVPWAGCSEPQCGCFRWTWTLKSSSLAKVSKHGPLDRTHRWQITDWNYYSVLKGGSTASAILKALKERIYETLSAWSIASKLTPHPFSALKRHRASATSVILKALNERIWWYKVLYPVSSTHPLIAGKSAQFWNMEKKTINAILKERILYHKWHVTVLQQNTHQHLLQRWTVERSPTGESGKFYFFNFSGASSDSPSIHWSYFEHTGFGWFSLKLQE